MVEPGLALPADVGADPDRPEADVIEQSLRIGDERASYDEPLPLDANPDDVAEQRLEVPIDDDDYPVG